MPNVPPLRFPEFTGEWDRMRVSDFLDFYSTNSLSWEQLEYGTGNLCNLHYGLIHVGLPTLINLSEHILPNIKLDNTPRNYELCQEGDVAFADASEDTNEVAKVVEFYELQGKDVVCGLHTIHGRDNKGLTIKGFKGYALSSVTFHNQIRRLAQGTKIYSVSTKNFAESYISLPSKEEQSKIVTLLSLLDKRIATQIRVIDKLESLIKGIRATVFNNVQPNTKLGEIADIYQPQTIASTECNRGQYLVFGANGVIGRYEQYNHEQPQICITCRGNTCGTVNFSEPFSWVTGNAMVINIDNNKEVNKRYLFHYLSSQNFHHIISGSGQPQIVRSPLLKFPIYLPSMQTQVKLAEMLDLLRCRLKAEQDILEKYQQQKAYLLQNMFI